MGSAAAAVSYEASQYGRGLLTYSLLQGMRGAALRDDAFVDVQRLFQYAADQVPQRDDLPALIDKLAAAIAEALARLPPPAAG